MVKNPPASAGDVEMRVPSLGREDPLEEEIATHSRILTWEIPWTEEHEGLQFMGLQKRSKRHNLATKQQQTPKGVSESRIQDPELGRWVRL